MNDGPALAQTAQSRSHTDSGFSVLLVASDGSVDALERARTAIISSHIPVFEQPRTRVDRIDLSNRLVANQFAALAYVGIVVAV